MNNPLALVDPLGLLGYCPYGNAYNGCIPPPCVGVGCPGGGGGGGGGPHPCSLIQLGPGNRSLRSNCGPPPTGSGGGGANGRGAANQIDRSQSCFGIFAKTALQPLKNAAETAFQTLATPLGSPSPSQYAAMAGAALQQAGFSLTNLTNTIETMVQAGAGSVEDAGPAIAVYGTAAVLAQSASTYLPAAAEYVVARAPAAALAVADYQLASGLAAEIRAARNGECGGDK